MEDYFKDMDDFENLVREAEQEEKKKEQPQLTERQTKALLSELSPKLKEELCHVLQSQAKGGPDGERPEMSSELARILTRFQRRAGLGPGGRPEDSGEETWPMYLGIFLFVAIAIIFTFLYIQEQYAYAEEEREDYQDAYWLFREF
mmetsp:Transcript_95964/g.214945  ORF Transcript_95964/g.214945 Transcript_95964/m.214945 type:complete len:146 (-) Transcript_95964:124-561(-)